jgi:hypothetical protein
VFIPGNDWSNRAVRLFFNSLFNLRMRGDNSVVLFLIICVISLFVSCNGVNKDDYNETDTQNDNESKKREGGISHGVVTPDPLESDFTLVYDVSPIELTYMLHNGGQNDVWGLSLFVNGVRNSFYVNDSFDSTLMYIDSYNVDEKKEIQIKFTPISGTKGEVLSVSFVVMLNPDFVLLDSDQQKTYGNNHVITQMLWKLKIESEPKEKITDIFVGGNKKELSEEYIAKYNIKDENSEASENKLDDSVYFEFYKDSFEETAVICSNDSPFNLIINAAGQYNEFPEINNFRISLYIDHKIVDCFNGNRYLDINVEEDKYTTIALELEKELFFNKNHIYIIAVPLTKNVSPSNPPIQKTTTKPIIFI